MFKINILEFTYNYFKYCFMDSTRQPDKTPTLNLFKVKNKHFNNTKKNKLNKFFIKWYH